MDYNQIRIRENAELRVIKIEPEQLEWMNNQIKRYGTSIYKQAAIKKIYGSPCCICREIPSVEILYQLQDAKKIERYCDKCIKSVYEREHVV